jgi:hypothetical protein
MGGIMATPTVAAGAGKIMVNVFDGARRPLSGTEVLIRVIDGNQRPVATEFRRGPSIAIEGLPFHNNFIDKYTVIASAKGHAQAGFTPVHIRPAAWRFVDLMLLKKDGSYNFRNARPEALDPVLRRLVAESEEAYLDLMERSPDGIACLLNVTTALRSIVLAEGSPLDYIREIEWNAVRPDRFFAWASVSLIDQIERAVERCVFEPIPAPGLFHEGATRSFKEVQFGEANVQITLHENHLRETVEERLVRIECDMDYYRDQSAHTLLEVLPNTITGSRTDPRQIYVLRWTAGKYAGVPDFEPPYTLA